MIQEINCNVVNNEDLNSLNGPYNCGYQNNHWSNIPAQVVESLPIYNANILNNLNQNDCNKEELLNIKNFDELKKSSNWSVTYESNNSHSEPKIRAKSSSKWRKGDCSKIDLKESIIDLNASKIYDNSIQTVGNQNWWSWNLNENPKQYLDQRIQNNNVEFYNIYPNSNIIQPQLNNDLNLDQILTIQVNKTNYLNI